MTTASTAPFAGAVAAPPTSGYRLSNGPELHSWSSLIGIITAIVGNVLISLALNVTRYAHIRLGRESLANSVAPLGKADSLHNGRPDDGSSKTRASSLTSVDPSSERDGLIDHSSTDSSHTGLGDGAFGHQQDDYQTTSREARQRPGYSRHSESIPLLRTGLLAPRRKTYLKSPIWWTGLLLMVIGEMGNFVAYGFAPASVVSPLGVVALISNCIIAPIMLHESFRRRDLWGVVVAIAGAVTIVVSAKPSETKLGPDLIWHAITQLEFEVYMLVTAVLMVVGMLASEKYGDRFIFIDLGLVGLFGAYTALSTKGVSSLLSHTLWRLLTFPITYLLLAVLVLSALLQIRYINRALQRFGSTQVIPTQFVLFTISVIVGSAILYRDFERATPARLAKFALGCAMTFLGVYFLTTGRDAATDQQRSRSGSSPSATTEL
ncbi:MAG: hypothetical protein M1815_001952 [Lichina confinis]|nr:MAG: hypothetical protein M1815_001952 [Lichina confinis]